MDTNTAEPTILGRFLTIDDPEQALALVAEAPEELLAVETLAELDRLIAAETDDGRRAFLAERRDLLENLRGLRQQFGELQEQIEALPEAERQFLAFMNIPSSLGMAALIANSDDATLDALEAAAAARLAEADEDEAASIQARLDDLRDLRAAGREAAQARLEAAQAAAKRLADSLIAWIQTPDWGASERYLAEHAADLLSDDAELALELLQLANPGNEQIPMHRQLLQFAREQGIDAAYAQLRRELAQAGGLEELGEAARALADNPLLQAVVEFLQAGDEAAARQVLAERRDLLLTLDASQAIEGFIEAVRQQGHQSLLAQFESRLALWNEAKFGSQVTHGQAQLTALDKQSALPGTQMLGEQAAQYLIVEASHCAIGDNATTLNILNVGQVPLRWKKPQQFRADLTEHAVGRDDELTALHQRLAAGDANAVVVGKGFARQGRSGAVRGLPGVGKSTLAAIYAERYASEYPGGVIWLQFDPSYLTAESAGPVVSEMAAFAYSGDVRSVQAIAQAQPLASVERTVTSLKNALFKPEAVRLLLEGHGRLLIIVDDIWHASVLEPVRAARPHDACLLVTTRDSRVARRVGNALELDVLNQEDALAMIGLWLPDMEPALAAELARAVGCHPLALDIALGDLAEQAPADWADCIQEINRLVDSGESLDFLPLDDDSDREQRLAAVLQYSYDALGRLPEGAALQRRYRALGSLARESDFDLAAAAAIWQEDSGQAKAHLQVFRARSLLNRLESGRWRQHSILRAHARQLQSGQERQSCDLRHAEHFLARMREADDRQVYYLMAPELPNLRHAFEWAIGEGLALAQSLLGNCADLLRSQNLGAEYLVWAERVLQRARQIGNERDVGAALTSLGNALQAAATLAYGEDRAARLRQALDAYDEALEKQRDVPLAYATT